ncbi:hypothetical protein EV401DRAFT_2044312 [Pisolithus croceorrhizus]|nr:hypothetical protein EV401DRAFT_2044312 [Pisolithus croceorrhizus]
MGMVSTEVLLPLVSDLLTFLGFVLILPHRHGSLRVPGGCARLFRAGLDGAGEYMLISRPFRVISLRFWRHPLPPVCIDDVPESFRGVCGELG